MDQPADPIGTVRAHGHLVAVRGHPNDGLDTEPVWYLFNGGANLSPRFDIGSMPVVYSPS